MRECVNQSVWLTLRKQIPCLNIRNDETERRYICERNVTTPRALKENTIKWYKGMVAIVLGPQRNG